MFIWVRMSRTGRSHLYIRQVESDIRFRIDELFRQNDIVIAFPSKRYPYRYPETTRGKNKTRKMILITVKMESYTNFQKK